MRFGSSPILESFSSTSSDMALTCGTLAPLAITKSVSYTHLALQSEMVLGCLVITLYKYSKMIQEATQTQINMSARKPNSKVAAMAVGISATTTVSIMLEVVTGSFRCGEVTTKSLFFNVIHLLLFFSQHLLAHSVVKHQITVSPVLLYTSRCV